MSVIRIVLVIATLGLGACATGHDAMRGSVVMKVSETEAHVCLAAGEAKPGDKVQLYKHVCSDHGGKHRMCKKEPVAIGEVTQNLNEHYSVVRFPEGVTWAEGYTVEPVAGTVTASTPAAKP